MSIEVSLLISVLSVCGTMIFGIINASRNKYHDNKADIVQITSLETKMDSLLTEMKSIRNDMSETKNDFQRIMERLVIAEQSAKQAHKRIDEFVTKYYTAQKGEM